MTTKLDLAAATAAYEALQGLDPDVARSTLEWLLARMQENRRGREAQTYAGPTPQTWEFRQDGCPDTGTYDTRAEGFEEVDCGAWGIVEITGHAAVCQEFVVMRPHDDGPECESFPTRAEAEAYASEMRAGEAEYLAGRQAGPKRPDGMDDAEALAFAQWWAGCLAHGCEVDETWDNENSESWLLRFRANMTPQEASRDALPF